MTDAPEDLGPIRAEHAIDGWQLRGDGRGGWHLMKDYARLIGVISATTPTTCSWQITTRTGDLRREASGGEDVAAARAAADEWVANHEETS